MIVLIPVWFYGLDSVMYLLSSLVGFLLSFYFNRVYSLSFEKRHMFLYLGFLILSMGLFTLSAANAFSYLEFKNCSTSCTLGSLDEAFSLEDFAYIFYFISSLTAYVLFVLAYGTGELKIAMLLVPLMIFYLLLMIVVFVGGEGVWYQYHEYFHLTAAMIMVFLTFKNFVNYMDSKSSNSLLVVLSFMFITLFHLFHLFSFANGWFYVVAHISLLSGFTILLGMIYKIWKECSVNTQKR